MGLFSPRDGGLEPRPEQKWDFINLKDFKSTSCFTPFAYAYLYFSLILSCAVYGVDTFTAVNLLAFDKWSSQIEPTQLIKFNVAKWIFSVCIILSVINLVYEHIRAHRVMRRGSVAECYLDNLAVRLESIRMGQGQGWRRFLVFAELTKSKKGAEYVALFTYFSFQSWVRVLVCSGPRQVVNALTLWAVYTANLSTSGNDVGNTLLSFFGKLKALAAENPQQTLILSGMLFTLVIWVFSLLSLLLGVLCFLFFLWGYIPRADGGLSAYCERKINKRLMKIVSHKIDKAMADDERKRRKAELKAAKKAGENAPIMAQATLPNVSEDKLAEMPTISRVDTMTTLPQYSSRPGTPGSFELNAMDQKRPMPTRSATASSAATYSSRAPLMGAGAEPGYASPPPSVPPIDLNNYPPMRPGTSGSGRGYGPPPPQPYRNQSGGSRFDEGSRYDDGYTASPSTYSSQSPPMYPPSARTGTPTGYPRPPPPPSSYDGRSTPTGARPPPPQGSYDGRSTPNGTRPPPPPQGSYDGRSTPNGTRPPPPQSSYDDRSTLSGPRPPFDEYGNRPASPAMSGYSSNRAAPPSGPYGHPPSRSATNPAIPLPLARGPPGGPQYPPPSRSATAPLSRGGGSGHEAGNSADSDYFSRPVAAGSPRGYAPSSRGAGSGSGSVSGGGGSGGYDYRPPTSGSQRAPPYATSAWGSDVESQRGGPPSRF